MRNSIYKLARLCSVGILWIPQAHGAARFQIECDTPAELDEKLVFCSDNEVAAQVASTCNNQLTKAIKEAGPELSAIYDTEKPGYVNHQKKEFHYTHGDYQKAIAKLDYLIEESTANLHRMAAYPPVMLDIEEQYGDHMPCFSTNYAVVDKSVDDLDQKITELKQTRAAASKLHAEVGVSDDNIENIAGQDFGKYKPAIGSGPSQVSASDITGIKKEAELSSAGATVALSAQKFKASEEAAAAASRSSVTKKSDSTVASSSDPASYGDGTWTAHRQIVASFHDELGIGANGFAPATGAPRAGRNEKHILQNEAAQRGADSIGALIWQSPSDLPDTAQLQGSLVVPASDSVGSTSLPASSAVSILPAGEEEKSGSFEIASMDQDLFSAVHDRYRKTEQFRRARLLHVPLSAFEANLK